MKNLIFAITLLLFCIPLSSQNMNQRKIGNKNYVKKNAHWFYKEGNSEQKIMDRVITLKVVDPKIKIREKVLRKNKLGYVDIEVPGNTDVMDYYNELRLRYPQIENIELNSEMKLHFTPNDTHLSSQWYLNTIHAYDAWNVTLGSPNITVAVIDYGIWWSHEDLGLGSNNYQNVWLNPNEDAWSNASNPTTGNHIDDDNNGYIDDWKGWNFMSSNNDTRASHYHGTMVSGIIAAKTNNGVGIAGIAGGKSAAGVKIMGISVGYTNEWGDDLVDGSLVDDAIIYAVDNGAKVINMSFGSIDSQPAIQSAVNYAVNNGVVLVASSGNEDNSGNKNIRYPAKYTNVIAVGATDMNNTRASFSFYGAELDCVAPGVQIYSTTTNSYMSADGTSFAAPQVSGIAALILSVNPNLSAQQVRNIIESTAQKVGGYTYSGTSGRTNGTWNNQMGYGLVDAKAAVLKALDLSISGPSDLCPADGTSTYSISNPPAGATVTWSCSGKLSIVGSTTGATCNIKGTAGGVGAVTANVNINGTTTQVVKNVDVSSDPADPNAHIYISHYSIGNGMIRLEISDPGIYGIKAYIWNAQAIGGSGSSQSTQTGPNGDFWTIPAGNYNVEVRAVTQCGHIIGTNTIYAAGSYSSSASPNPADNILNVNIEELENGGVNSLSATSGQYYDIRLYNMQGSLLRSLRVASGQTSIDVSGLPGGNYFLHVYKNGTLEPQVHKIIISH